MEINFVFVALTLPLNVLFHAEPNGIQKRIVCFIDGENVCFLFGKYFPISFKQKTKIAVAIVVE